MGFFDIFKKGNKQGAATSDNGVAGPFFMDGLTEPVINPKVKSFNIVLEELS